jgi:hypothetical protein
MNVDNRTEQERTWGILYAKILKILHEFGTENQFGKGDYLVAADNYGWPRHTIEIHKLHMLQPAIVNQLQALLREFAGWEIVVAVDVPGTENLWPRMGLTIRAHEIIDDLQRQYLPVETQHIQYEGSRVGTGSD